jgi:hypothetical protein
MYKTAAPVMRWHKKNEEYLINREPVATIGVVWSQVNNDFYGRDNADELVELPWRGFTHSLIRARIPYLPVHADHIERDASKFNLLILPNLASMTADQVSSIKRFIDKGGSVIATGKTSLFDEWGDQQNDYALADIFGAHFIKEPESKLNRVAGNAYHTYLRLTPELRSQVDGPKTGNEPAIKGKRHVILNGFEETDILPYGGLLQSLKIDDGVEVPMTFIPQFPVYPPETAWMREPKTDIPGVLLRTTSQGGRIAFIPADIDTQFARNNLPDHANLLKNIVRWASKEKIPLSVEGAGLVDCHLYQQRDRNILHVVNLTSAATWRQPLDELISIGPLTIKVGLSEKVKGKNVNLLVSNQKIKSEISNGWVKFEINSISDHELVVIS